MSTLIHLPTFDPNQWDAVETAFRDVTPIPMHVIGTVPEGRTATIGTVRAGWQEGWLWAFAMLEDNDIFTAATGHNQWMWELGDVLEVFLRREDETAYQEVHVTPNNWRLLLKFPDDRTIARLRSGEETDRTRYCGNTDTIQSWAKSEPEKSRWLALVGIPFSGIVGETIRLTFCRYDAAEGRKPVNYSTTQFTIGDFHRQQEWDAYTLAG